VVENSCKVTFFGKQVLGNFTYFMMGNEPSQCRIDLNQSFTSLLIFVLQ